MEERSLNLELRKEFGSSASRRYRSAGKIPVTIANSEAKSIPALVSEREFVHVAEQSKYTDVISVASEDKELAGRKVLVKDLQKEPMKGKVLHVDLQALETGKSVKVKVPITLVGTPKGVKLQGGILTQTAREVVLACDPDHIPAEIEVDTSHLGIGERIIADELNMPTKACLKSNSRENICSVVASRTTRLQEAAGGAEEDAEGAAEDVAEGGDQEKTEDKQD